MPTIARPPASSITSSEMALHRFWPPELAGAQQRAMRPRGGG